MLQAVIFDFDGVITDSELLHLNVFNQVLEQFNIKVTTEDYYRDYLGMTDAECFKTLNRKYQIGFDDKRIEDLIKQKNGIFEELAKSEGKIIEGVHSFLQMLKQNNIPMAIFSGSLLTEIELILATAQLRSFFEVIVSAEQVKNGKPHPEGFYLALEKLNDKKQDPIQPSQCVVIEDATWGLEAAKAAGMHTIAVTNSYQAEQLTFAEKIVTKLSELNMSDLQKLCV